MDKRRAKSNAKSDIGRAKKQIDFWLESIAVVIGIILFLVQKTPTVVALSLLFIFLLLLHPALYGPWLERSNWRRAFAVCALAASLIGLGYLVWPQPRYPELTEVQRKEFVRILRTVSFPRQKVRIGCEASPGVCASAGNYIEVFQGTGWIVGSGVERGLLGKPKVGVTILAHGSGTIPDRNNPKWGLWVALTKELEAVKNAFGAVGLTPTVDAVETIPENEMLVVFGPEPNP